MHVYIFAKRYIIAALHEKKYEINVLRVPCLELYFELFLHVLKQCLHHK